MCGRCVRAGGRGDQGAVMNVQLQRVPADAVRDRFHMFELFAQLKVHKLKISIIFYLFFKVMGIQSNPIRTFEVSPSSRSCRRQAVVHSLARLPPSHAAE